jgi:hypothetical protein
MLAWLMETFDLGYSLGICNCRDVRGSSSMSIHAECRAIDFGLPMIGGRANPLGDHIVNVLGRQGNKAGVQAIVWAYRNVPTVFSRVSPEGRPYKGVHPHRDHLHIELTRAAGELLTLTTLRTLYAQEVPDVKIVDLIGRTAADTMVLSNRTAHSAQWAKAPVAIAVVRENSPKDMVAAVKQRCPIVPVGDDGSIQASVRQMLADIPEVAVAFRVGGGISDTTMAEIARIVDG